MERHQNSLSAAPESLLSPCYRPAVDVVLSDCSIEVVKKSLLPHLFASPQADQKFDRKILLQPLSVRINGGSLFAILGGSGSGKTSLLNVIAQRYDRSSTIVGGDGVTFITSQWKRKICKVGYVTQADYLLPYLTVTETIAFAAKLKMQQKNYEGNTTDLITELVNNLILELGLSECALTMIGDDAASSILSAKRGISGGEKRRVSVALQIISNPEILCADEPTSGLDSFTAVTVMEALRKLSLNPSHRTTVICSIHQPRTDIFQMFDGVLLLGKGGYAIYCGTTTGLNEYFESLGFSCPVNSNPADYYMDLSSIDPSEDKIDVDGMSMTPSKARVRYLVQAFKQRGMLSSAPNFQVIHTSPAVIQPEGTSKKVPWVQQLRTLTVRSFMNTYRDPWNLIGGIAQSLLLSLIITAIFWQLPNTISGIQSLFGLLYIITTLEQYIFLLILVERYCTDSKIFDRELQDDMYHPSAYFIANIISALPQLTLQPIIYAIPPYFGCGVRQGTQYFFVFVCINIMLTYVTNGLAWFCVSLQRPFSVASLIANMNYTFLSLTAGFLLNVKTLPIYVSWVQKISFLNYSYQIVMSNEFANRIIPGCPYDDDANCMQYNGNDILESKGISVDNYSTSWPVMIAMCIMYHIISAMLLDLVRYPITGIVAGEYEDEDPLFHGDEIDAVNNSSVVVDSSKFRSSDFVGRIPSSERQSLVMAAPNADDLSRACIPIKLMNINLLVASKRNFRRTKKVPPNSSYKILPEKEVLSNITVEIQPKRLVAIMGGSGSGKTTLLNLIAGRIPHSCLKDANSSVPYEGSGFIRYGKEEFNRQQLRERIGYVQQFDYHLPSLTVTETLMFHAAIRLPGNLSQSDRLQEVQKIVSTLGLQSCAYTRVGGVELKGISGGEKRRLSIAVQLLHDPSICLFDEPTTGLDAFTARHVVQTLQTLAYVGNRTVLISIHQPRYDVFDLFDDVILLSRSKLVWAGEKNKMLTHLAVLGYPCPQYMNPGDFILDLSSVDLRTAEMEEESTARLASLVAAFAKSNYGQDDDPEIGVGSLAMQAIDSPTNTDASIEDLKLSLIHGSSVALSRKKDKEKLLLMQTLPYLMWRSATNLFRQPVACSSRITQAVFFALILGCFYAPVGHDQNSIQNRIGNLYQTTSICFIGMLGCIAIFPEERNVFLREYADGGYSLVGFIMTYFALAIPFAIFSAFLFSLVMTYAIGLKPSLYALGIFTYCVFCFIFVGECVGVTFCAVFMHVGLSVNIMSVVISVFSISAGFISLNMPPVVSYFADLSPLKWGAYILSNVVFADETFTCSSDEKNAAGQCPFTTGDEVLALYGFNGASGSFGLNFHVWILAGITVGYTILSFVVFRFRAYQLSH